jgi:hypothetical protein
MPENDRSIQQIQSMKIQMDEVGWFLAMTT